MKIHTAAKYDDQYTQHIIPPDVVPYHTNTRTNDPLLTSIGHACFLYKFLLPIIRYSSPRQIASLYHEAFYCNYYKYVYGEKCTLASDVVLFKSSSNLLSDLLC